MFNLITGYQQVESSGGSPRTAAAPAPETNSRHPGNEMSPLDYVKLKIAEVLRDDSSSETTSQVESTSPYQHASKQALSQQRGTAVSQSHQQSPHIQQSSHIVSQSQSSNRAMSPASSGIQQSDPSHQYRQRGGDGQWDIQHRESLQQRETQQQQYQQQQQQIQQQQQQHQYESQTQQSDSHKREIIQKEAQQSQQDISQSQQQQVQQEAYPTSTSAEQQQSNLEKDSSQSVSQKQVTMSAGNEVGDNLNYSPQTHHQQHPAAHGKKRMLVRSGGKFTLTSSSREHVKATPSSASEIQRATTTSEKKGPKSEYDFPDSPDDDLVLGKPGSYMALSSSTRSPRRGVVESSDSRSSGTSMPESSKLGDSHVQSSADSRSNDGNQISSFSRDQNEAMADSSFMRADQSKDSVSEGKLSRRSSRHDGMDVDDSSNISHPSVDSTHSDRMMIDELGNIDSSTNNDVTSASPVTERPKSSRSSRDSDNSPRSSTDIHDTGDRVSQSRTPDSGSVGYSHRSKSPRGGTDSHYSNLDYPHSSSDLPTSTGSHLPTSSSGPSSMPVSSNQPGAGIDSDRSGAQRGKEPAPLLSSQYEPLSDDEDDD